MEIELRVILLAVGVIILFIVGWDFFKRKPEVASQQPPNKPERKRSLEHLEDYAEPEVYLYETAHAMPLASYSEPQAQAGEMTSDETLLARDQDFQETDEDEDPELIITISIMSRDQYGFDGAALIAALESAGLEFGKNEVFHRVVGEETLFSVANAVEPGYFIIETLADEHVPGVTLIFLPERLNEPLDAFDKFIRTAKQVAFAVNGELVDHERRPLTLATLDNYRKETQAVAKRK